MDTIWTEEGVLIREVSSFQVLNYIFGERKGVLIRDSNYDARYYHSGKFSKYLSEVMIFIDVEQI